jgi:protein translocase SecG subunit
MVFIIGLLTAVMVLTCFVLVFLILLQLPKKESGAGLAFGGAASDALFGAGSGTVLTKITKYLATLFFVLAVVLSIFQNIANRQHRSNFQKLFSQPAKAPAAAAVPAPPAAPATAPALPGPAATPGSNLLMTSQAAEATNPAPTTATNKPPAPTAPTNKPSAAPSSPQAPPR